MKALFAAYIFLFWPIVSPGAINITNQPTPQEVFLGQTATFSVGVAAAPGESILYQWYFNGAIVTNATSPVLTIDNVQGRDLGNYFVRVGNLQGTTQSDTATLRALAPIPSSAHVAIDLVFPAETGSTYLIQASSNLTEWATITSPITAATNEVSHFLSTRRNTRTFFRAVARMDTVFPKTLNGTLFSFTPTSGLSGGPFQISFVGNASASTGTYNMSGGFTDSGTYSYSLTNSTTGVIDMVSVPFAGARAKYELDFARQQYIATQSNQILTRGTFTY